MKKEQTCGNCNFSNKLDEQLFCHESPPNAVPIPQQHPISREMIIVIQGVFPPITPDNFCGKWREKQSLRIIN